MMKTEGTRIHEILTDVAHDTDTIDLVTVLYLIPGYRETRGTAYVRKWLTKYQYYARHGKWQFGRNWPIPHDLPCRYKLIRMRLDPLPSNYPHMEHDLYGWQFHYSGFADHLATLFAHELHHFRRYHLGLHPGEGEHSANRWALAHVKDLGYMAEGIRLPVKRNKKRKRNFTLSRMDPYASFRNVVAGDTICICRDPRNRYGGQSAKVMRPIRSNSKRMVIQTRDGHIWRWPMSWLEIVK
jgi:hypothetical protein